MDKVIIIPDEHGNVIRQSDKSSEYGYVRLSQDREVFSSTGWLNVKPVSALLHGKMEDFKKVDMKSRKELPGKIIIKESTTPFNENDPDRDLKYAGTTGIICCSHGEPIYRKTFYDATGSQEDELIAHTNGDAIREANASMNTGNKDIIKAREAADKLLEDENQIDLEDSIKEVEEENSKEEVTEEVTEEIVEDDFDDSFEL